MKELINNSVELAKRKPGRPPKNSFAVPLREQLIEETILQISKFGSTDVNATTVCEKVGVKFASVNYNFGSWNGLIAEAGSVVYTRYVDSLWDGVKLAANDPEARLNAYIAAQVKWAIANPGWGAFFNYPFSARTASQIMQTKFGHITNGKFQLNHARLTRLTIDLRDGVVTPFDFDETNYPHDALISDDLGLARATLTGWSTLGMMVWLQRGPTLETEIADIKSRQEAIIAFAMSQLISAIKSDAKNR